MSWFSTRASRKVQEQNARLVAENKRLVELNAELTKALSERMRASVVDAFKRRGGILNPPPERLHPNTLTDAQRQDAADDAMWKRVQDGLGDPQ